MPPTTMRLSQKTSPRATSFSRLPWPHARQGVTVTICESQLAVYSVVIGLSEWHITCPRPWIYFLPTRRAHGREFGEPCGQSERLTLFRGVNGAARVQAQMIFGRMCADLRKFAAKEGRA